MDFAVSFLTENICGISDISDRLFTLYTSKIRTSRTSRNPTNTIYIASPHTHTSPSYNPNPPLVSRLTRKLLPNPEPIAATM